ncbi:GHKL domain-containing protein [Nocardioides sp. JQ2195]|uniref:sensor histidine kinase n=1 Tax=Nocardioides sp. JQ2195 TaxID=2592334 RepID=UPI00143EB1AC|nr:ATP-binding protein [Nocardioides sp. JQ2195]QIX26163.1 GHKL domain-containing protein [Nocardioides sp. JQ2195]
MWSSVRSGRFRLSLAGQFLALQLIVLLVVLAFAAVISVRQSSAEFRDDRGTTLRAAAQQLANLEPIRSSLASGDIFDSLNGYLATTQSRSASTYVALADAEGDIVLSLDPDDVGGRLDLGGSDVQQMRMWTGDVTVDGKRSIAAQVPVVVIPQSKGDPQPPRLVGIVMVSEPYPTLGDRIDRWLPDLARFLGIGLAVGLVGSWLLSRLIKRRTRGLEPAEIAALADQREAVLHSIREGVVAVSDDGRVTVISDSALELLELAQVREGASVRELDLEEPVREALLATEDVHDQVLVVAGRVMVLNRNRVLDRGRQVGTVTTLRDRTELLAMQSELSARESITETLRAQTHEFNNQLHTISGLLQLEEYDEVSMLIGSLARQRAEISQHVLVHVDDPAVAALLIAKVSLAAERGVSIVLTDDSDLPRLDPDLSADVGTVLGNLVDNAVDATVAAGGPRIDVRLLRDDTEVVVQVVDTGPGVADTEEIFRRGYSTKPSDASGRGVGLALVQVVCERRSGVVSVHNDAGAVFTARLPLKGGTTSTRS